MEKQILRASLVAHQITRWHMVGQYPHQDVAQHSFRVAFIAAHIADNAIHYGFKVNGDRAFVLAAMHDLGETVTGDIPSHVKSAVKKVGVDIDVLAEKQGYSDVPDPYKWIVKAADVMEAAIFTQDQYGTTDCRGRQVADNIWSVLTDMMYHGAETDEDRTKQIIICRVWDDLRDAMDHTYDYNLKFEEKSGD